MPRKLDDWDYLQNLCRPNIRSYEQYQEAVVRGLRAARIYVYEKADTLPDHEFLRDLHRVAFGEVYPFAGSFRNEPVRFGPNRAGAFQTEITRELDGLREESLSLFASASKKSHAAQAICFYHAKFQLIHPFLDGNGRLGRLIMEVQAYDSLRSPDLRTPAPATYLEAVDKAQSQQALAPLAKALLGINLPEELSKSPKPIELQPFVYRHTLPSGRVIESLCYNSQEAEAIMLRLESPELTKQLESLAPEAELPVEILVPRQRKQEQARSTEPGLDPELKF